MSKQPNPEARLAAIGAFLVARGFAQTNESGHSSGGAYLSALFRRGPLEIGFIVRNRNELGCPNYSIGAGYAGHDDMVEALGHADQEHLVPGDSLAFRARDGGDAFDALQSDFEKIILPAFDRSEKDFRASVDGAVRILRERRGW